MCDGDASRGPLARKSFGLMLEALDDLTAGKVHIATGSSLRYALWGVWCRCARRISAPAAPCSTPMSATRPRSSGSASRCSAVAEAIRGGMSACDAFRQVGVM